LVLLNDPTFVEAARGLAVNVLKTPGDDDAKLAHLWRRVALRTFDAEEREVLAGLLTRSREQFAVDPDAAKDLLAVGDSRHEGDLDVCELAAWTIVAHALLNLDEVVTKR